LRQLLQKPLMLQQSTRQNPQKTGKVTRFRFPSTSYAPSQITLNAMVEAGFSPGLPLFPPCIHP
jgi:hypothetical protein